MSKSDQSKQNSNTQSHFAYFLSASQFQIQIFNCIPKMRCEHKFRRVVSINSGASKVILLKDLVIDKSVQSIVLIQLRNHDRSRISSPSICFTSEVSRIVLIILLVP
jgi:hypothetical protein